MISMDEFEAEWEAGQQQQAATAQAGVATVADIGSSLDRDISRQTQPMGAGEALEARFAEEDRLRQQQQQQRIADVRRRAAGATYLQPGEGTTRAPQYDVGPAAGFDGDAMRMAQSRGALYDEAYGEIKPIGGADEIRTQYSDDRYQSLTQQGLTARPNPDGSWTLYRGNQPEFSADPRDDPNSVVMMRGLLGYQMGEVRAAQAERAARHRAEEAAMRERERISRYLDDASALEKIGLSGAAIMFPSAASPEMRRQLFTPQREMLRQARESIQYDEQSDPNATMNQRLAQSFVRGGKQLARMGLAGMERPMSVLAGDTMVDPDPETQLYDVRAERRQALRQADPHAQYSDAKRVLGLIPSQQGLSRMMDALGVQNLEALDDVWGGIYSEAVYGDPDAATMAERLLVVGGMDPSMVTGLFRMGRGAAGKAGQVLRAADDASRGLEDLMRGASRPTKAVDEQSKLMGRSQRQGREALESLRDTRRQLRQDFDEARVDQLVGRRRPRGAPGLREAQNDLRVVEAEIRQIEDDLEALVATNDPSAIAANSKALLYRLRRARAAREALEGRGRFRGMDLPEGRFSGEPYGETRYGRRDMRRGRPREQDFGQAGGPGFDAPPTDELLYGRRGAARRAAKADRRRRFQDADTRRGDTVDDIGDTEPMSDVQRAATESAESAPDVQRMDTEGADFQGADTSLRETPYEAGAPARRRPPPLRGRSGRRMADERLPDTESAENIRDTGDDQIADTREDPFTDVEHRARPRGEVEFLDETEADFYDFDDPQGPLPTDSDEALQAGRSRFERKAARRARRQDAIEETARRRTQAEELGEEYTDLRGRRAEMTEGQLDYDPDIWQYSKRPKWADKHKAWAEAAIKARIYNDDVASVIRKANEEGRPLSKQEIARLWDRYISGEADMGRARGIDLPGKNVKAKFEKALVGLRNYHEIAESNYGRHPGYKMTPDRPDTRAQVRRKFRQEPEAQARRERVEDRQIAAEDRREIDIRVRRKQAAKDRGRAEGEQDRLYGERMKRERAERARQKEIREARQQKAADERMARDRGEGLTQPRVKAKRPAGEAAEPAKPTVEDGRQRAAPGTARKRAEIARKREGAKFRHGVKKAETELKRQQENLKALRSQLKKAKGDAKAPIKKKIENAESFLEKQQDILDRAKLKQIENQLEDPGLKGKRRTKKGITPGDREKLMKQRDKLRQAIKARTKKPLEEAAAERKKAKAEAKAKEEAERKRPRVVKHPKAGDKVYVGDQKVEVTGYAYRDPATGEEAYLVKGKDGNETVARASTLRDKAAPTQKIGETPARPEKPSGVEHRLAAYAKADIPGIGARPRAQRRHSPLSLGKTKTPENAARDLAISLGVSIERITRKLKRKGPGAAVRALKRIQTGRVEGDTIAHEFAHFVDFPDNMGAAAEAKILGFQNELGRAVGRPQPRSEAVAEAFGRWMNGEEVGSELNLAFTRVVDDSPVKKELIAFQRNMENWYALDESQRLRKMVDIDSPLWGKAAHRAGVMKMQMRLAQSYYNRFKVFEEIDRAIQAGGKLTAEVESAIAGSPAMKGNNFLLTGLMPSVHGGAPKQYKKLGDILTQANEVGTIGGHKVGHQDLFDFAMARAEKSFDIRRGKKVQRSYLRSRMKDLTRELKRAESNLNRANKSGVQRRIDRAQQRYDKVKRKHDNREAKIKAGPGYQRAYKRGYEEGGVFPREDRRKILARFEGTEIERLANDLETQVIDPAMRYYAEAVGVNADDFVNRFKKAGQGYFPLFDSEMDRVRRNKIYKGMRAGKKKFGEEVVRKLNPKIFGKYSDPVAALTEQIRQRIAVADEAAIYNTLVKHMDKADLKSVFTITDLDDAARRHVARVGNTPHNLVYEGNLDYLQQGLKKRWVVIDGRPRLVTVAPELEEAMTYFSYGDLNPALRLNAEFNRWFKRGTVGWMRPGFAATVQPFMDSVFGFSVSRLPTHLAAGYHGKSFLRSFFGQFLKVPGILKDAVRIPGSLIASQLPLNQRKALARFNKLLDESGKGIAKKMKSSRHQHAERILGASGVEQLHELAGGTVTSDILHQQNALYSPSRLTRAHSALNVSVHSLSKRISDILSFSHRNAQIAELKGHLFKAEKVDKLFRAGQPIPPDVAREALSAALNAAVPYHRAGRKLRKLGSQLNFLTTWGTVTPHMARVFKRQPLTFALRSGVLAAGSFALAWENLVGSKTYKHRDDEDKNKYWHFGDSGIRFRKEHSIAVQSNMAEALAEFLWHQQGGEGKMTGRDFGWRMYDAVRQSYDMPLSVPLVETVGSLGASMGSKQPKRLRMVGPMSGFLKVEEPSNDWLKASDASRTLAPLINDAWGTELAPNQIDLILGSFRTMMNQGARAREHAGGFNAKFLGYYIADHIFAEPSIYGHMDKINDEFIELDWKYYEAKSKGPENLKAFNESKDGLRRKELHNAGKNFSSRLKKAEEAARKGKLSVEELNDLKQTLRYEMSQIARGKKLDPQAEVKKKN